MKHIQPFHIVQLMVCCFVAMALLCLIMPATWHIGDLEIRTPQLASIFGAENTSDEEEDESLDLIETEQEQNNADTLQSSKHTVSPTVVKATLADAAVVAPTTETAISANETAASATVIPEEEDSTDMHQFMTAFYEALPSVSTSAIRVVHYGDSQIEEDRISMQVRRALQGHYGGGGVGLIPLHQTIGTRTLWQATTMNDVVQNTHGGPKRYLVYGPKSFRRSTSKYGPMGQVAVMDNALVAGSEDISLQVRAGVKQSYTESYFNRVHIWKDGDITASVNKATDQDGDVFILPDSTQGVTIQLHGKGDVYGISLEADHGIMIDNIPMRGCSGAIFTGIASAELQHYFAATKTRLIIMQYGGNIMPYTTTKRQVAQYVEKMRTQIQYLKYLAPNSSILFVGPSDMCERRDGQLQTYKMIPVMDRALKQMAIEEEIGYFSLYHCMGGKGSMVQWHNQGLAGGDYVHFTPKGADKAGSLLAKWILNK
ncbi:MAG: GDSL-type esterase/lipase family protein [Paludibacteraceae bacterium]|nr:GDSL-type esterase/lipase family protein [Paludibacteraceae bacterium]